MGDGNLPGGLMQDVDWQKVLLRVLVGAFGLIVFVVGWQWSRNGLPWQDKGPDMAALTSEVRSSMQSKLSTSSEYAPYGMTVVDVQLVKSGEHTFDGYANVKPKGGATEQVPVEVTVDGERMMWRTEPGAFLFLMRQDLSGVGS